MSRAHRSALRLAWRARVAARTNRERAFAILGVVHDPKGGPTALPPYRDTVTGERYWTPHARDAYRGRPHHGSRIGVFTMHRLEKIK